MTTLYQIDGENLVPVSRARLATEDMIQRWVAADPSLVGLDVLVLGREVSTAFGGRIDILGIDRDGNLAIIELKRDRTPREIVAQCLDYASWVVGLTTPEIYDIALEKLGRPLSDAFRDRFDTTLPERLNASHQMIIVAGSFDASSQRIVDYLFKQHDIAINAVFFAVFADGDRQYLATDWLIDPDTVDDVIDERTRGPWTGTWYANVGEGPHRAWDDMRRYGFLAAGGARKYSGPLARLSVGDRIYAYQKGNGYVGRGTVTQEAVPARDFEIDGKPLLDQPLSNPELAHDRDDPELAEYLVGIRWEKTVPVTEAKTFAGVFANQNIVCKLRDRRTLEFLEREFA